MSDLVNKLQEAYANRPKLEFHESWGTTEQALYSEGHRRGALYMRDEIAPVAEETADEIERLTARVAELERLDREAATHVESVIAMKTHFTGEEPYVGWKGLGLALTEHLDRLTAERDALRAEVTKLEGERIELTARLADAERMAEALAAENAKLREAEAWQRTQRVSAMQRRHMNAPEDPHVMTLCERYGYGAVMDSASRLWARQDSMGAFYVGGCIGLREETAALAAWRKGGEDA